MLIFPPSTVKWTSWTSGFHPNRRRGTMRVTRATLLLAFIPIFLFGGSSCQTGPKATKPEEKEGCAIPSELQGAWRYTSWRVDEELRPLEEYYSSERVVRAMMRLECRTWWYHEFDSGNNILLTKTGNAEVEQHESPGGHSFDVLVLHRSGEETEKYFITMEGDTLTLTRWYEDATPRDTFRLSRMEVS
jgi:hypothetical protein